MSKKISHCVHCFETFDYQRSLNRHLKDRPAKCYEKATLITESFEQLLKEKVEQKVAEQKAYGEKRNELVVAQKTQLEDLTKRPSSIMPRKKNYSICEIIRKSDVEIDALMEIAINGSKKTVDLIERILFITRAPTEWGIKIVDFNRQKYAYYSYEKKNWINITIDDITENFMMQVCQLYDRVIVQKSKELDRVNKQYPYHASDAMAEKNTEEANKIHEKYSFCTEYRLCLLSGMDEPNLYQALKVRLSNLFNKYL